MALLGLGYAGFGSDAIEDWRQFGTGLVGLQAVERGNSLLAFRMDDRKQRVVIDRALGDGARFFGWEVLDAAALDALAAKLLDGGQALMPLGSYGWSRKFGWMSDRFGVSWQLNLP